VASPTLKFASAVSVDILEEYEIGRPEHPRPAILEPGLRRLQ